MGTTNKDYVVLDGQEYNKLINIASRLCQGNKQTPDSILDYGKAIHYILGNGIEMDGDEIE